MSAQFATLDKVCARCVARHEDAPSTPARAAYAASAPPALPALGTASFVAPRYFAIETATLIPRALKLCVGLSDSVFDPKIDIIGEFAAHAGSGVPPSPNETGSTSSGNGNALRDNATMIFPRASSVSRVMVRASPRRDRRLQTAVYCRSDKDFAAETIRARVRTRCIRDASEAWERWNP